MLGLFDVGLLKEHECIISIKKMAPEGPLSRIAIEIFCPSSASFQLISMLKTRTFEIFKSQGII